MNNQHRKDILSSFTVEELDNPITKRSITEALERADAIFNAKYEINNLTQ